MFDDKETVEYSKRESRNGKEVESGDHFAYGPIIQSMQRMKAVAARYACNNHSDARMVKQLDLSEIEALSAMTGQIRT